MIPIRDVQFCEYLQEGTAFVMAGGILLCRTYGEFALIAANVNWHPWKGHCPTWTDATECQCMLGGEA
jgi:hypothetical protein